VSNGVTAFKAPSQKRAIHTLLILAIIVSLGLIGLTYLAGAYYLVPAEGNTVLNQLGLIIFGKTIPYFVLMGKAAAILVIASSTLYAGLPILLSLMARNWRVYFVYPNWHGACQAYLEGKRRKVAVRFCYI
jgi:hypothetical protein